MGILVFSAKLNFLLHQKSDLEYRNVKIARKIRDLQRFSTIVSTGKVTMEDLLHCPSSCRASVFEFIQGRDANVASEMNSVLPGYLNILQQNQNGQPLSQDVQNYVTKTLRDQAREDYAQKFTKFLKIQEDQLMDLKESTDEELTLVKEDIESTRQERNNALKDWKPNYGGVS